MSKFVDSIKKHRKAYLIYGLIDIVIGTTIFLVMYLAINKTFIGAIDGTGVAGAILFALFVFVWLSRNGSFDTMSYGFSQLFSSMFGKKANKYNDFAGYKQDKNTKREIASYAYFMHLFVSLLFLIAFAVLEIIYHTVPLFA